MPQLRTRQSPKTSAGTEGFCRRTNTPTAPTAASGLPYSTVSEYVRLELDRDECLAGSRFESRTMSVGNKLSEVSSSSRYAAWAAMILLLGLFIFGVGAGVGKVYANSMVDRSFKLAL